MDSYILHKKVHALKDDFFSPFSQAEIIKLNFYEAFLTTFKEDSFVFIRELKSVNWLKIPVLDTAPALYIFKFSNNLLLYFELHTMKSEVQHGSSNTPLRL